MTGRMDHKLARHGDYLMAFRDTAGHATEPKIAVDNEDKATISPERRVALVTKIDKAPFRTYAAQVVRLCPGRFCGEPKSGSD